MLNAQPRHKAKRLGRSNENTVETGQLGGFDEITVIVRPYIGGA